MRSRATAWGCLGFGALSLACAVPCLAAGAWLTESGGADTAMAGAGRSALSLDAASQVANPAALALLPRSTVTAAAMPLVLDTGFRGSAATPGTAGDRSGLQSLGGLYGAHVDGGLVYGLSAYSYFGLGFELGDQWVGRRAMDRAALVTFNVAPAVGFRVSDRLSVGASVAAQWAHYDYALAAASDAAWFGPPAGLPDGRVEIEGSSWEPGGQLGLLYSASEQLRVGLDWTAPVHHSFGTNLDTQDLHPVLEGLLPAESDVELRATVPQQLAFGLAHGTREGRVVSFGLTWQDWSAMGDATVRLPGMVSDVFPGGLRDTWGASLGFRQPVGHDWVLSAGLAYESDPALTEGVPVYFPVTEQWRIAAGAERRISEDCRLRVALSVMDEGSVKLMPMSPPLPLPGIPQLTGSYTGSRVALLAVAVDYDL